MEETKLFGIGMSKGKKIRIILCLVAGILCLVLYVLSSLVYKPVVNVVIPSGGLVTSVFEAQNMVYTQNASLTKKYHFVDVPYMLDTPDGTSAQIGTSTVIAINGLYFLYDTGSDVESVLRNGYTDVVVLNAKAEDSILKQLKHESGYINGCSAEYYTYELKVYGAEEPQYICIYQLSPSDNSGVIDTDLFVGVMASGYTTETFDNLAALGKVSVGTLQFDNKYGEEK